MTFITKFMFNKKKKVEEMKEGDYSYFGKLKKKKSKVIAN